MNKKRKIKKVKLLFIVVILLIISFGIYYLINREGAHQLLDKIPKMDDKTKEDDQVNQTLPIDFTYYEETPTLLHKYYYKPTKVKGVFVNASAAGSEKRLNQLIQLADETEVNAFVIDVKEDDGRVTFDMNAPLVDEIGAEVKYIRDIDGLMDKLYDHNIFPIARIVCFKDPYLAKNKTEYAIKNKDGSLWYYKKIAWLNPYNRDSWKYIVDVAKEAAKVGFKEIQFDYIRFEATRTLENANLGPESETKARTEIIAEFIDYAKEELEPYNIVLSADVFGIVFLTESDARRIGQNYVEMVKRLDVICPMVYPSHYGFGFYNTPSNKHTDWFPYEIIKGSMDNSNEVIKVIEDGNKAIVRPWLQAFTASYLKNPNYRVYEGEELRAQIQGAYDAGLEEWILWHAGSNYDKVKDGLLKEGEE